MSHDKGKTCSCRTYHAPGVLENERHHIFPLGMGGKETPDNVVWLCPTAHTNVHELLRWFVREERVVPWREVLDYYDVPVSRYAYILAQEGYTRYRTHQDST